MRDRYKHLLNFLVNLSTLIVDGGLFGYIWYTYYTNWESKKGMYAVFHMRGNWAVIAIYLLFIFLFTRAFGGYRINYMRGSDIILSNVLALLLSNAVAYLELCLLCHDYVSAEYLIGCMFAEIGYILIWSFAVRFLYTRLYPPRQMLLIYGQYAPDDIIAKLSTRPDKYRVCGTLNYTADTAELYNTISRYHAVVLYDLPDEYRNQLMKYCYLKEIRVYVIPKISDIIFQGADDIHLFDTPVLLCRNQALTMDQLFFKRLLDIIVSIIGIILSSPIMLVIAIAIKAYDGGPVIYKQERLTRNEKVFQIYKFRSMSVGSEKQGQITAKKDKRVTPVGRVIRAVHLDELPQLFNILQGDMAVVGPRPEWRVTTEKYINEIPEFRFRLKVKAGLTGYAQVYGKYNTTPLDKLKLDLTYIENYSFWLDIKLILLTVKILFSKENTEGVEENQKSALKKDVNRL